MNAGDKRSRGEIKVIDSYKNENLILALPKGRILTEVMPIVRKTGIEPEPSFNNPSARQLRFSTNITGLDIIRVRSFDVATFVAFGGAHLGVVGNDVLMEFDYAELYAPLNLNVGHCRICVAAPTGMVGEEAPSQWSSVRIATKYPTITQQHFAERGVQAECIKLNGAMELAPQLGLCSRIVDLVSTGNTLKANGLVEIEEICSITSRFAVNRTAWKTRPDEIGHWVARFQEAAHAKKT